MTEPEKEGNKMKKTIKTLLLTAAVGLSAMSLGACAGTAAKESSAAETSAEAESSAAETDAQSESVIASSDITADDAESISADGGIIGMPNPWSEYDSLADAENAAGINVSVPEEIAGGTADAYRVLDTAEHGFIEIIYADKADGDETARVRKAGDTEEADISGDYNTYAYSAELDADGVKISVRGDADDTIKLAVWQNDGSSYALSFENGVSGDELSEAVKGIK